ncbi:MAG: 3-isopropylmalate dehydratase small subunit [Proteobacteria bacterium]|nr:3-isopropylmalate dehydratase small subunit [Pseudomonadota bacterium]
MSIIKGRAWAYGANIDTDQLAPIGSYQGIDMAAGAKMCLREIDPKFAASVREGDIFVGTDNLGIGSSREQAPTFLKILGIRAVVAKSFARIFYRNCFNIGLPALILADAEKIGMGHELSVDPDAGTVHDLTTGVEFTCQPIPPHLMQIVAAGGLMPYLKERLKAPALDRA